MTRNAPRFLDEPAAAPPPAEPVAAPPRRAAPTLLEARDDAPDAIGADWNPRVAAGRRRRFGTTAWAAAGIAIILGSWILLAALGSALNLLSQSAGLGGVAVVLYAIGVLLLLYAVGREWASLRRLKQVDHLRAALHGPRDDLAAARTLSLAWLDHLAPQVPQAASAAAALPAVADRAELRATLRNHLREPLAAATKRIGVRSASEVGALVALSPHDSWDGLIVAWRGMRVIRQAAELHGLRPGPAVSLALLRRVARAAVETAVVDIASQAATDHLLTNVPLIRHLAAIPAASTAAVRLHRLASITARACSPLEE